MDMLTSELVPSKEIEIITISDSNSLKEVELEKLNHGNSIIPEINFVQHSNVVDLRDSDNDIDVGVEFQNLTCSYCNFESTSEIDLKVHLVTHLCGNLFCCTDCDFKINSKNALKKHYLLAHTDTSYEQLSGKSLSGKKYKLKQKLKEISCPDCNFKTRYQQAFAIHQFTHTGKYMFQCNKCNFKSNIAHNFKTHVCKFQCKICKYKSKFMYNLMEHEKVVHNIENNEENENDIITENQSETLQDLNKSFSESEQLSGLKKVLFLCDTCNYQTEIENDFKAHQLTHSKENKKSEQSFTFRQPKCKMKSKFRCKKCDYVTGKRNRFLKHYKSHSRQKTSLTLKCDSCDFITQSEVILKKHNKNNHEKFIPSNSSSKSFQKFKFNCEECEFGTNRRPLFTLHKKFYHIFYCNKCDFQTKLLKHLTEHNNTSHGEVNLDKLSDRKNCEMKVNENEKIEENKIKVSIPSDADICASLISETYPSSKFTFLCNKCDYKTNRQEDFLSHIIIHKNAYIKAKQLLSSKSNNIEEETNKIQHSSSVKFKCDKCLFVSNINTKFLTHVCKFYCTLCNYKTKFRNFLLEHERIIHNKRHDDSVENFQPCERKQLEKKSESNDSPNQHYQTQKNDNFQDQTSTSKVEAELQCSQCTFKTVCEDDLQVHKSLAHDKSESCNKYDVIIESDIKNQSLLSESKFLCDMCDYKSTQKQDLTAHKLTHIRFYCTECNFETKSKLDLIAHEKVFHSGIIEFLCMSCEFTTNSEEEFKKHQMIHTDVCMFQCDKCDFKTTQKVFVHECKFLSKTNNRRLEKNLTRKLNYFEQTVSPNIGNSRIKNNSVFNLKSYNTNQKDQKQHNFQCPLCEYTSSIEMYFKIHEASHNGKKSEYCCSVCKYNTKVESEFKQHQKTHCSKENEFICTQCEYRTFVERNFKIHEEYHNVENQQTIIDENVSIDSLKSSTSLKKLGNFEDISFEDDHIVESNRYVFHCDKCDFKTLKKYNLTSHKRSHEKYACELCSYKTKILSDLTKHQNHSHLKLDESKKHSCLECDYKTDSQSEFEIHYLNHTNNYKFHCDKCDFKTNKKSQFSSHECKFYCTQCNYKTKFRNNLTEHERIVHNAGKQFPCTLCDYMTNKYDDFVAHQSLHKQDEKEMRCSVCNYKTIVESDFKAHLIKHSNKKFTCIECEYETSNENDFLNHQCNHFTKDKFVCLKCDYNTISEKDFKIHQLLHSKETIDFKSQQKSHNVSKDYYQCGGCIYKTVNEGDFKIHQAAHINKNKFGCSFCNYSTDVELDFKFHQTNNCQEHTKFSCNICTYKTKNEKELKYHQSSHNQDNKQEKSLNFTQLTVYYCKLCPFKTKWKNIIIRHDKTVHLEGRCIPFQENSKGIFKFACGMCDFKTRLKSKLFAHKVIHNKFFCTKCRYSAKFKNNLMKHETQFHQKGKIFESRIAESVESQKIFQCEQCDFKTYTKHEFESHECTLHCKSCNFVTQSKNILIDHENTHTESMFRCSLCKYTTNSKRYFELHETSHLKTIKLQCSSCQYNTESANDLIKHLENHSHEKEISYPDNKRELFNMEKLKSGQMSTTVLSKSGQSEKWLLSLKCNLKREFGDDSSHYLQNSLIEKEYEMARRGDYKNHKMPYTTLNERQHSLKEEFFKNTEQFACRLCDFSAVKVHIVRNHIQLFHNEEWNRYYCDFKAVIEKELILQQESHISCTICFFPFKYKTSFYKHVKKNHSKEWNYYQNEFKVKIEKDLIIPQISSNSPKGIFSCSICEYKSCNEKAYNIHHQSHKQSTNVYLSLKENQPAKKKFTRQEKIFCTLCNFAFKSQISLSRHIVNVHKKSWNNYLKEIKKERKFFCHECGYKTTSKNENENHQLLHTKKHIITSNTIKDLANQMVSRSKIFHCPLCSFTSLWRNSVHKHIITIHRKKWSKSKCDSEISVENGIVYQEELVCPKCNYKTSNKKEFKSHQMLHCNMMINSKAVFSESYVGDEQSILLNREPFICRQCNFTTLEKTVIQKHFKMHHDCEWESEEQNFEEGFGSDFKDEKELTCNLCEYKAANQEDYKNHVIIHSGIKSISNTTFKKTFPMKNSFSKLKILNSKKCSYTIPKRNCLLKYRKGNRDYHCDKCDFKTTRKVDLISHKINHDRLSCSKCTFKTKFEFYLTKHITNFHTRTTNECSAYTLRPNGKENDDIISVSMEHNSVCDENTYKTEVEQFISHCSEFACSHCEFKSEYKSMLIDHEKIHHSGIQFKCDICEYETNNESNLKIHKSTHSSENVLVSHSLEVTDSETKIEEIQTKIKNIFESHLSSVHGQQKSEEGFTLSTENKLYCDKCDFSIGEKNVLEYHNLGLGTSDESRNCNKGIKPTSSEITHSGNILLTCDQCDYKSVEKQMLSKHKMTVHKNKEPLNINKENLSNFTTVENECIDSESNFEFSKSLFSKKENIFACLQCDYTTCIETHLKMHEKLHLEERNDFNSLNCDFTQSFENNLQISENGFIFNCSHCSYTSASESDLKIHELMHSKDDILNSSQCDYSGLQKNLNLSEESIGFSCTWCDFTSKFESDFKIHEMTHSEDKNIFSCSQCDYKSTSENGYKIHEMLHFEEVTVFSCSHCDFKSNFQQEFKIHERIHSRNKVFTCSLCDYVPSSEIDLKNHCLVHTKNRDFKHLQYEFMSNLETDLKDYDMSLYLMNKNFQCAYCEYSTNIENDFAAHNKKHLTYSRSELQSSDISNDLMCSLCDYKTKNREFFKRHQQLHEKNFLYQCEKCNYRTSLKDHFIEHQSDHSPGKFFKCSFCNYKTKWHKNLYKHERIVHNNVSKNIVTKNLNKLNNAGFNLCCSECSYRAEVVEDLINHQNKIHNKVVKKLKCSNCKYETIDIKDFINHQIIHNTKEVKCPECLFTTKNKNYLVQHIKNHSGNYKYCCNKCGYKSNAKTYFNKHSCMLACGKCNYKTKFKKSLKIHKVHAHRKHMKADAGYQKVEQSFYKFECKKCDYKTNECADITNHKLSHYRFFCPLCDYKTQFKKCLIKHKNIFHSDESTSHCKENLHNIQQENHSIKNSPQNSELNDEYQSKIDLKMNISSQQKRSRALSIVKQGSTNLEKKQMKLFNCSNCNFITRYKRLYNNHQMQHHSNKNELHLGEKKTHTCSQCDFTSNFKKVVLRHELHQHVQESNKPGTESTSDVEEYKFHCPKCSYKSNAKASFQYHLQLHSSLKSYHCSKCEYSSKLKIDIQKHEQTSHTDNLDLSTLENNQREDLSQLTSKLKFKCPKCPYKSNLKKCYQNHLALHSGIKFYHCFLCSFKTKWKSVAVKHERFKHNGEQNIKNAIQKETPNEYQFACLYCEYKTNDDNYFEKHKETHLNMKPYHCSQCDYSSKWKQAIRQHEKVIHNKGNILACSQCNYKAQNNYVLLIHQAKHSTDKPFSCSYCEYRSKWKNNILQHERNKHSELKVIDNFETEEIVSKRKATRFKYNKTKIANISEIDLATISSQKTPRKYMFKCQECDFKTRKKHTLLEHKTIHLEEKLYHCAYCDYRTKWKNGLSKHESKKHSEQINLKTMQEKEAGQGQSAGAFQFTCSKCFYKTDKESCFLTHKAVCDSQLDSSGKIKECNEQYENEKKKDNPQTNLKSNICDNQLDCLDKILECDEQHKNDKKLDNPQTDSSTETLTELCENLKYDEHSVCDNQLDYLDKIVENDEQYKPEKKLDNLQTNSSSETLTDTSNSPSDLVECHANDSQSDVTMLTSDNSQIINNSVNLHLEIENGQIRKDLTDEHSTS